MNSHLVSVICPSTEFQDAGLFVKWEILYIDFTTRFEDGRRFPLDQPVAVDGGFGRQRHLEVSIRTTHTHTHTHISFFFCFDCFFDREREREREGRK
jgi:hypothetical protein